MLNHILRFRVFIANLFLHRHEFAQNCFKKRTDFAEWTNRIFHIAFCMVEYDWLDKLANGIRNF